MHIYIFIILVLLFLAVVFQLIIEKAIPSVYRGLVNMLHRTDKN